MALVPLMVVMVIGGDVVVGCGGGGGGCVCVCV